MMSAPRWYPPALLLALALLPAPVRAQTSAGSRARTKSNAGRYHLGADVMKIS